MSFPAEMAEGTGYGSRTVTFVYPRRAKWRAVDEPHVPAPMTSRGDVFESDMVIIERAARNSGIRRRFKLEVSGNSWIKATNKWRFANEAEPFTLQCKLTPITALYDDELALEGPRALYAGCFMQVGGDQSDS